MEDAIVDETELVGVVAKFEPGKTYAKAISNYAPQRDDELALNIGEYVEIITKFPDSWWEGKSLATGRIGMFPSTFTQLFDPQKEKNKMNESQQSNSSEEEVESDDDSDDEEEDEEDESGSESEASESGSEDDDDEEEESDDEDEDEESESESEEEEKPLPKSNPPRIVTPIKSSSSEPASRIPTPKKVATPKTLEPPAPHSPSRQRSASSSNGNAGSAIPEKERAKSAGENKPSQWAKPVSAMPSPKKTAEPGTKKKKKKSKSKQPEAAGFLATLEGADIRKYRDTLAAKEIEIEKLKKEVKTLTVLQKRQDRAIKTLDTEKGEMPRLLQGMHDELRVLREKLREYQSRHGGDEKMLQNQHEEILKLKKQIEDQQKVLKSKGVDAGTVNQKVKHIIEEKEKMINELQHKANILSRAKEMEEKKYRTQLKEYQSEIDKLSGEMDKLKTVLKEHGLNRIVRDVEKSPSPTRGRIKPKGTPSPSKKKEKTSKEPKDSSSKKKKEKVREPPVLPQRTEVSMPVSTQTSQLIPPSRQTPPTQPAHQPVYQQPSPVQPTVAPTQPSQSNQSTAAPAIPSMMSSVAFPNRSTMQPMFSTGGSSFNLMQNTNASPSTTSEPSPRDEFSYPKKSPKNLVNPFTKLSEPSPPVTVPPVTVAAVIPPVATSAVAQRTTIVGGANNPSNPIYGSSSNLFGNTNGSSGWKSTSTTSITTQPVAPTPVAAPATTSPPGSGNTGYVPSFTQPQEQEPARPLFLGGGQQPAAAASESKPSWMFGPTAPAPQESTDVFKPNFGFNRKKDKDKWKITN